MNQEVNVDLDWADIEWTLSEIEIEKKRSMRWYSLVE